VEEVDLPYQEGVEDLVGVDLLAVEEVAVHPFQGVVVVEEHLLYQVEEVVEVVLLYREEVVLHPYLEVGEAAAHSFLEVEGVEQILLSVVMPNR
jgi:hypothetical protein